MNAITKKNLIIAKDIIIPADCKEFRNPNHREEEESMKKIVVEEVTDVADEVSIMMGSTDEAVLNVFITIQE